MTSASISSSTDIEGVDPRVLRTKTLLFESLLRMIQKKRWDKIRVQDLLEDTGISRSAFYAHFDNKYDLLTAAMPRDIVPLDDESGQLDLVPLFTHVDEAALTLRPLLSQPILSDIVAMFHRQFAENWTKQLSGTKHAGDTLLPEMLAGALTALIRDYAAQKKRRPPGEVAAQATAHFARLLA